MPRIASVLCAAVLVALLAGCGQSALHSGSTPGDYDGSTSAAPPPAGPRTTVSAAAALSDRVRNAIAGHTSVRFTLSVGRSTVRGAIALREPVAVRAALPGAGEPAGELIRVGTQQYLTSPRIVADGLGTPWARVPLDDTGAPSDSPAGLLRRCAQAIPAAVLERLRTAGTLTDRGEGGAYEFRVDLRRLAGNPPATRAAVTEATTVLRLDDRGLPQRVRTVVRLPGGPLVTTIRYGAWDAPVDITAPAPDRIGAPTAP